RRATADAAIEGGRGRHRALGARHRDARGWRRGLPARHRHRASLPRRARRGRDGPDVRRPARLHRPCRLRHAAVRLRGGTTMTATRPFTLGAVAYDPKVVTIWEG